MIERKGLQRVPNMIPPFRIPTVTSPRPQVIQPQLTRSKSNASPNPLNE